MLLIQPFTDEQSYSGAADRSPDSNNANPEAARALNAKAPATLATLAAARNIFLIYISTDYVFPGIKGEAPYQVDSPTNPPNLYGQNKLEGEKGVLAVSSKDGASSPNVVLRVPVLYGRGDSSDKLEGAVNALVTQIMKAQNLEPGSPSNTVDDWAVRYPTCTSDVARVCRDIATLYTSPENRDKALPRVLQYSAEERFTKWEMCQVFADILGVSLKNMEPSKPDENDSVKRPFDCHLDTKVLKELGINVDCISFRTWWRRDMGAFRK